MSLRAVSNLTNEILLREDLRDILTKASRFGSQKTIHHHLRIKRSNSFSFGEQTIARVYWDYDIDRHRFYVTDKLRRADLKCRYGWSVGQVCLTPWSSKQGWIMHKHSLVSSLNIKNGYLIISTFAWKKSSQPRPCSSTLRQETLNIVNAPWRNSEHARKFPRPIGRRSEKCRRECSRVEALKRWSVEASELPSLNTKFEQRDNLEQRDDDTVDQISLHHSATQYQMQRNIHVSELACNLSSLQDDVEQGIPRIGMTLGSSFNKLGVDSYKKHWLQWNQIYGIYYTVVWIPKM